MINDTFICQYQESISEFWRRNVSRVDTRKVNFLFYTDFNVGISTFSGYLGKIQQRICSVNNDESEEILTYSQIMNHIAEEKEDTTVWKFQRISSHEGSLHQHHPNYKGSRYNVLIEWENGEITSEPLDVIARDDLVTCALYAKENNLLDESSWKRFKKLARRHKKFIR